jgi:ComF family protein
MFKDLIALVFPNNCAACDQTLYRNERTLCTKCRFDLPKTNYHSDSDNKLAQLFWGKLTIEAVTALYHFDKGARVQHLLHELKYKGNTAVGEVLGNLLAHEMKNSKQYHSIEGVVPVPLHPKKKRKRGYNQSYFIAKGVAEVLEVPVLNQSLIRIQHSDSQTRKSKFNRWKNVSSVFATKKNDTIAGKHVLLVDDVITTGATLEACAAQLLKVDGVSVSIAALACA